MDIQIFSSKTEMGAVAAAAGAESIRKQIAESGSAAIILATGASQFEMISALVKQPDIDWSQVACFHLDEYVGLPIDHPASFRKYLKERFVEQLPKAPLCFHFIDGETDARSECNRLSQLISQVEIDVAFIGIGENGHLAFNDPPADFETTEPYLVVNLDDACRRQQYGEGWFKTLDAVPRQAISMAVRQILKSKQIVCTVPDERKSNAVQHAVEGEITNQAPASALQNHPRTTLFLDRPAASKLTR
ncbi:MAG: glucosamine-6-phosphate deaminase [Planctomycetota bacterium]|nr:glucosamine-6-phosphate deaminase [Planctomycetota bacterium]